MTVLISKSICNNLYLLFVVIFVIYLSSSKKVFSKTETSHQMTGSSVTSVTAVTFLGKCPCLVCQPYCFISFSVIATLFDVVSCIFKLKDFNCSHSFVPFSSSNWVMKLYTVSHIRAYIRCLLHVVLTCNAPFLEIKYLFGY